ncbi:MAG TPA: hypothetical protein VFI91_02095 [Longimicrobiaceae bacterium]|nr:hypothetical protein [Longimicrobiaceae bacterium]
MIWSGVILLVASAEHDRPLADAVTGGIYLPCLTTDGAVLHVRLDVAPGLVQLEFYVLSTIRAARVVGFDYHSVLMR